MMCRSNIQSQPGEFESAADHVGGAAQHRTGQPGVEVRAGHLVTEHRTVPLRGRIVARPGHVGADGGQIVVWSVVGREIRTGRQHAAPVEVEHQLIGLVDRDHPQRRQSRRRPARLGRIRPQPNHFGAGVERVADDGEPVKHQAAIEQVGLDPLGHQRRLPDRHIAHQPRMRQRRRQSGHRAAQIGVQRQPQPVPDDRLVRACQPRRQCHRRRPVEDLPHREIIEVRPALANPRIPVTSHNDPCWQAVESRVNFVVIASAVKPGEAGRHHQGWWRSRAR